MSDEKLCGEVAQMDSALTLGASGPGFESRSRHQLFEGKTVKVAIIDAGEEAPFAGAFMRPDVPGNEQLVVALNLTFLVAGYDDETPETKKRFLKQTFADVLAHELIHACEYVFECGVSEEIIERATAKARDYPIEEVSELAKGNDAQAYIMGLSQKLVEIGSLLERVVSEGGDRVSYQSALEVEKFLTVCREYMGEH